MYEGREDRRGDDRRATPRGERPYGRRIDCAEEKSAARTATPARGGGRRDPEAWASRSRG